MTALAKIVPIPAGPHEFAAEMVIKRPVGEVYPLLDLADPRHAKRQLGDRVEAVAGQPRQFELVVAELPDAVFTLTVTHESPGSEYAFSCTASQRFGRVLHSHEHYALHPSGKRGCRLVLTQTVTFDGPLDQHDHAIEAMMLTFSNLSALSKIKLHAEQGVEAVRALMAEQHAALDAFGCDAD